VRISASGTLMPGENTLAHLRTSIRRPNSNILLVRKKIEDLLLPLRDLRGLSEGEPRSPSGPPQDHLVAHELVHAERPARAGDVDGDQRHVVRRPPRGHFSLPRWGAMGEEHDRSDGSQAEEEPLASGPFPHDSASFLLTAIRGSRARVTLPPL